MPIPSRLAVILVSVIREGWEWLFVPHAELRERLGRTAVPVRHEGVADVAQVFDAQLAREEARGGEVAETVEERDTRGVVGLGLLGPGDGVEQGRPLGVP